MRSACSDWAHERASGTFVECDKCWRPCWHDCLRQHWLKWTKVEMKKICDVIVFYSLEERSRIIRRWKEQSDQSIAFWTGESVMLAVTKRFNSEPTEWVRFHMFSLFRLTNSGADSRSKPRLLTHLSCRIRHVGVGPLLTYLMTGRRGIRFHTPNIVKALKSDNKFLLSPLCVAAASLLKMELTSPHKQIAFTSECETHIVYSECDN